MTTIHNAEERNVSRQRQKDFFTNPVVKDLVGSVLGQVWGSGFGFWVQGLGFGSRHYRVEFTVTSVRGSRIQPSMVLQH